LAAAFPDLFIPGNLGGIIVGAEPNVISSNIAGNTNRDLPIHLEALYRFKVNDNISITPGIIAVLNPEGNSANDPIILGTIRTTFTF
jgi:carbohydrate-selective porin OprB